MDLYPAIDLRGGRCVRLAEGDFARETVYSDDPVDVARSFAAEGARWLHVVDLDAARTGERTHRDVVAAVSSEVHALGVRVQSSGGVRSMDAVAELLSLGVDRVVIGTAAVEDPTLISEACSEWPGRVAVGLDHRDGLIQVRGWTSGSNLRVIDMAAAAGAAGASAVIVTDISRDGMMAGPDLAGLTSLLETGGVPVIASGGVSSLDDIKALAALETEGRRLEGVITGRAVYEGKLDVSTAVRFLSSGVAP